ncbi:MAG TPA: MlaD family protein [Rhizomicrobium sp.]|nr:MlaD family protein [Rhizomicrobium sp.]
METKANYVAVGIFVMALVLGLVVALLWLTGAQYAQEYAYYQTYFSGSVSGLGSGTSVRYNGIEVGRVSKLNFDPNNPKMVQVVMQIDPKLQIHSDSVASIASQGLTGGSFVEIDGGSKSAPILKPQYWGDIPKIRSKPSTLQQIEQTAPELIAKLNRAADKLNVALTGVNDVLNPKNRAAISGILVSLDKTTGVLAARSTDIDNTLRNFSSASDKINVDLSDLRTTLGDADKAVLSIGSAAKTLDTTISTAQVGQLTSDLRGLVRNLNRLSNQLEREPTRLLFGDRREGYTPK